MSSTPYKPILRSPSPQNPGLHTTKSYASLRSLEAQATTPRIKGTFPNYYLTQNPYAPELITIIWNRTLDTFGFFRRDGKEFRTQAQKWVHNNIKGLTAKNPDRTRTAQGFYAKDQVDAYLTRYKITVTSSDQGVRLKCTKDGKKVNSSRIPKGILFTDGKEIYKLESIKQSRKPQTYVGYEYPKMTYERLPKALLRSESYREFLTATAVTFTKIAWDLLFFSLFRLNPAGREIILLTALAVGIAKGVFKTIVTIHVRGRSALNSGENSFIESAGQVGVTAISLLLLNGKKMNPLLKALLKGCIRRWTENVINLRFFMKSMRDLRMQSKETMIEGMKTCFKTLVREILKGLLVYLCLNYIIGITLTLAIGDIVGCVITCLLQNQFLEYATHPPEKSTSHQKKE